VSLGLIVIAGEIRKLLSRKAFFEVEMLELWCEMMRGAWNNVNLMWPGLALFCFDEADLNQT
jgi:hypothetical protein